MNINRIAAVAIVIAVALALAWMLRAVLPVIAIALVYAVVTWPLVKRLERRLPRGVAIMAVDIGIALIAAGVAIAVGPALYAQAQDLLSALPQAISRAVESLPAGISTNVSSLSREAISASLALLRSASAIAAALILIPVLAAYFQLDQQRYEAALFSALPEQHRSGARRALPAMGRAISGFVRGQLLVSALVGLLIYVVLVVCGVPYAPGIALLTAVFDLVPYLGGIAAFVPSLLLAFAAGGIAKAILVAVLITVVFEVEAQFLSPQIVGSGTQLPPSGVMVALLVGTALFGVLGLYLAVPFTAACAAAIRAITIERPAITRATSRVPVRASPPSR